MKKSCRLASNLSYLLKIDLADGNLIIGLEHMKKNIDQYTCVGNLVIILATDYWTTFFKLIPILISYFSQLYLKKVY